MTYITSNDFIVYYSQTEFDQLTDKDNTGAPSLDGYTHAELCAENLIDAACVARYVIPLSPVDDIIKQICGDITRYYLYDDAVPDEVRKKYELAMKMLEAIKAGKMLLVDAVPLPVASDAKQTGSVYISGSAIVFTDSFLAERP